MTDRDWRDLVMITVTDPAAAGRRLIDLDVPRSALWLGFLIAPVLNTILLFGPSLLFGQRVMLPGFLAAPLPYAVFAVGGLAASITAIFWTGRIMGGSGRIEDVAAVTIWLQLVRDLAQAILLVLQVLFPLVAVLLALAVTFYSIFILLHFINAAHRLGSLGRSAGVLIMAVVAVAMVALVLMSVAGGPFGDPSAYV